MLQELDPNVWTDDWVDRLFLKMDVDQDSLVNVDEFIDPPIQSLLGMGKVSASNESASWSFTATVTMFAGGTRGPFGPT